MIPGKLRIAWSILELLDQRFRGYESAGHTLQAQTYCNGREQGFAIHYLQTKGPLKIAAFAEARSSDQLVVWTGTYCEFMSDGNIPNEKAVATYFNPGKYTQVVDHIADFFFPDAEPPEDE